MSMFRVAYIAVIAMLVYLFCIMISLRAQMQPEQSGERDVTGPSPSAIASPMPRDEEPAVKTSQEAESSPIDAEVAPNKMPDITGTWQLQESKGSFARIQKSDEDGFDFDLHWPVRGQGRPLLKLKWHATTDAFVATAPWPVEKASHDDAVYVVKATMNNTSLEVTINLGEKAQKHYEKLREEEKANKTILDPIWFPQMTFVKLELDEFDVAGEPAAPPKPVGHEEPTPIDAKVAPIKMPDISGTWQLQEYQNGYAQIRKLKLETDGFDFELHWPGSGVDRPSLKLKWLPKEEEFEGTAPWPLETWAKGNAVYRVKPLLRWLGYRDLGVRITPGDEAREHYESIVKKLKADGADPSDLDGLLHPEWQKVVETVNLRFGATDILAQPQSPKRVEGTNYLVTETEDGLAAFSKSLGTWEKIEVPAPKEGGRLSNFRIGDNIGTVVIGQDVLGYSAVVGKWDRIDMNRAAPLTIRHWTSSGQGVSLIVENQLLSFSPDIGKWGTLTIPDEYLDTTEPVHGGSALSIQLGDTTYVFSTKTARWTSPDEPGDPNELSLQFSPPKIQTSDEKSDATATNMPDISGTWQLPEYGNKFAEIQKVPEDRSDVDYIVVTKFNDVTHWLRLHWNPDKGYFEGQSTWPLDSRAKGTATYVIKLNDDLPILEVDITLDEKAQQDFKVIAAKIAADRKSRGEDLETGGVTFHIPIEQQLLHPQWHLTVSPELVQLFDRDPAKREGRLKTGDDFRRQYDEYLRRSAPPTTPEVKRLKSEVAKRETRAAETAGEIRTIVKKKLAGESVDENRLGELRKALQQTLAKALDVKLKLEAQQVEHLESRLTRLKGLMDQRKSLRDQIIDRRMHELLDTDATQWDVEVAKGKALMKFAPHLLLGEPASKLPATRATTITIDLYGGRHIHGTKALFDVVDALNKIPDVVTNTREVGDGDKIVMAIVADPSHRTDKDKILKQSIDEALKQGGIEDVRWELSYEEIDAEASQSASPTAEAPNLQLAGRGADGVNEFRTPLAAARNEVAAAKLQRDLMEKLAPLPVNLPPEKLHDARLRYEQALQAYRLAQDEHAAVIRDLELQIDAANLELENAEEEFANADKLNERGILPRLERNKHKLQRDKAAVELKRLQNRLEFMNKIIEDVELVEMRGGGGGFF